MAWLSGLAGKAENILNKIDKNTAAVLNKEKNEFDQTARISNVNCSPQHNSIVSGPDMIVESPMRSLRSIHTNVNSVMSSTAALSDLQREEELMNYLNTPSVTPLKNIGGIATGPPTPSSLIVEHSTENSDSISDLVIHSTCTSPEPLRIVLDLSDNESSNGEIVAMDLDEENSLLRREIEKLRNELIVTSHVEKSIENAHDSSRQKLETLRREYEYRLTQQRLEMERLIERSRDGDARKTLKAAKHSLQEKTEIMNKQQTDHQKEMEVFRERLRIYEIEAAQNMQKLSDMQTVLDRSRSELNSTRINLEQHRARAMKTLQEKDKLIAELRNDSSAGSNNDTLMMELNQLRQECEVLRDENQQVEQKLLLTREELINADLKVEEISRKSIEANREAHEVISVERRKRIEAEEDARLHMEEVRGLRDELENQLTNWSVKARKQENEITRLRSQLSAASTPSSAVESRLSSLTQTLVSKQQALESLTTEKNALRLQLEKIEQEYRKILANSRKNSAYNSVNDTDDAKAQVPTFFMETPFDTGVARRALLQFWVFVVLLSQSPDAH